MIFRVPPYDICGVVLSETEYMIWTVKENSELEDTFDVECSRLAQKLFGKTFIQLKISHAQDFAESHHLYCSEMLIRVKDCQIVFSALKPMTNIIKKQAKLLRNRKGTNNITHMSSLATKRKFKSGKQRNLKLKICEDGSDGSNIARLADMYIFSDFQSSQSNLNSCVQLINRRSLNTLNREAEKQNSLKPGCFSSGDVFKGLSAPKQGKSIPQINNTNISSPYSNAKKSATNFIRRASERFSRRSRSTTGKNTESISDKIKDGFKKRSTRARSSSLSSITAKTRDNLLTNHLNIQRLIHSRSKCLFEPTNDVSNVSTYKNSPDLSKPTPSTSHDQARNYGKITTEDHVLTKRSTSNLPAVHSEPKILGPIVFVADVNITQPDDEEYFIVFETVNPFPKPSEKARKCVNIRTLFKPTPEQADRLRYIRENSQSICKSVSSSDEQNICGKAKSKSPGEEF